MVILALALLARAGDPAPADAEIVVYDEIAVELARQAVAERLEATGYDVVVERDDHVVYRHPQPWRGEVRLYDDGWVAVKRQPVQIRPPGDGPLAAVACVLLLPCLRAGGQLVSRQKLMHQKVAVLGAIDPEVDALADRIADREVEARVGALPDHLERLWWEGIPLTGGPPLETPEERKAALLAFWDSRTNTVWGDRVRLAVEAFLRAEVQTSDTPFTDEEITAFNASRRSERRLDLESPWHVVADGLTRDR